MKAIAALQDIASVKLMMQWTDVRNSDVSSTQLADNSVG